MSRNKISNLSSSGIAPSFTAVPMIASPITGIISSRVTTVPTTTRNGSLEEEPPPSTCVSGLGSAMPAPTAAEAFYNSEMLVGGGGLKKRYRNIAGRGLRAASISGVVAVPAIFIVPWIGEPTNSTRAGSTTFWTRQWTRRTINISDHGQTRNQIGPDC